MILSYLLWSCAYQLPRIKCYLTIITSQSLRSLCTRIYTSLVPPQQHEQAHIGVSNTVNTCFIQPSNGHLLLPGTAFGQTKLISCSLVACAGHRCMTCVFSMHSLASPSSGFLTLQLQLICRDSTSLCISCLTTLAMPSFLNF